LSEVFSVLVSLGHSEKDARRLLDAALEKKKQYRDVQVLLQAVYDQGKE
jgi:Holliday junction DNA helicase RuvA